jgi:hypothetical protein
MRYLRKVPYIAIIFIFCMVTFLPEFSAQSGAVQVGEPLHIYLRRQPVQDMTYLYFHPPDEIYEQKSHDNLSYRKTLLERGTGHDFIVLYFPQDSISNFLQFEPNASIPFTYNFTISTVRPNINYILNIKIDIDYDHDGRYDKEISFDIRGEEDDKIESKTGIIPVDVSELKKFDEKNGGRLRVNISRKDEIDTTITIYCGYRGYNSYLVLPFSKYKYEGEEPGDGESYWPWILAGAGLVIITGTAYFYLRQKKEEEIPHPVEKRKGARRRR